MGFMSSDMLTRIRNWGRLDSSDAVYTDAVIYDLVDSVMQGTVNPAIQSVNEDYFLTYRDYSLIADCDKYTIPSRAAYNKIHSVYRLNSDKTNQTYLPYYTVGDKTVNLSGDPQYHDFLDDVVLVYPTPSAATEYLRIYYHYTPSVLAASTDCMLITGGVDTGVLTGNAPTAWVPNPYNFDIVSANSPFALIHADLVATGCIADTSITFTLSDLDTDRLGTGTYYVTQAGHTCFPMAPQESHYLIANTVICQIRDQLGDEGYGQKYVETQKALETLVKSLTPRKGTEFRPIKTKNSLYEYFS